MLKADFHIHTHYSHCSNMKPEDVVRTAIEKGYDIIGVVDHNSIKGGLEAKRIAGRKILVIPGEEIKTNLGEIIILFSDGKYNRNIFDIIERAKEMRHFLIVPHPFDLVRFRTCLRHNINKIKDYIDAIEVFNSRSIINRFNLMAENYAEKNNITKIAGSDAHFKEEIGNLAVYLDCDKNIDSVIESLKKDKIRFEGKRCSLYSHFKSMITKKLD